MALGNLLSLAKKSVESKLQQAGKPTPFNKPASPALKTTMSTPSQTTSPFNLAKINPIPNLQMGISSVQNNQKRIQELKAKAQSQGLTASEAAEYARLTGSKTVQEATPKFSNTIVSQGDRTKAPNKAWEAVQDILNPNRTAGKTDNELAQSPQQPFATLGSEFTNRINEKFPNLKKDANAIFKNVSKRLDKPMPSIFDPLKTAGKQIIQGGLDLTGGETGVEEPKIVEGLKGMVFGALGFTPGGAVFNAAVENPAIKPYADEAFGYLDTAKQALRDLPAIQGLPEEVKDLVDVGVELAAFSILHQGAKLPFKKSQTVEIAHPKTGKMVKIKVPVDTAGWRSFKETLAEQVQQIKKNPIEFLKQQQVGLSIKTVNEAPKGKANEPYNPKVEAERKAMEMVQESVKRQEAARKAGKPTPTEKAKEMLENFKMQVVDRMSPIDEAIRTKQKQGGYEIRPEFKFDDKVDRFYRANEIAGQFLKDKGFEKLIQDVPDLDALNQYLIARHSQTLEGKGKTQLSRDKVKDQAILDGLKHSYEPLAQRVTQYSQDVLNYMVESNLISKEMATKLQADYPTYVPLNKIFSEFEASPTSSHTSSKSVASLSKQTVVQKLGESIREIENPLESLLDYTYKAHVQGAKNMAAKTLADYRTLPGFEDIIKPIEKPANAKGKSTISYLENGKKKMIEVPDSFARAAKGLEVETLNLIQKMMNKTNRVFKAGTTGLNIPFAISNVAKDIMTAWINSPYYKLSPQSFVQALTAAVGKNDLYAEMVRSGGGGRSVDLSREAPKATIKELQSKKSLPSKIANKVTTPSKWLETIENLVSVSEDFNRVKVFNDTKQALLKQGYSEKNANIMAATESRNATANFSRGGELRQALNTVNPFMSAGISGARAFNRAFKRDPAGTSLKIATTVLLPEVASVLWNTSDSKRKEIYDTIDDYEKDGNFIFISDDAQWNPEIDKWDGVYKIPKPPGISDISVPIRKAVEQIQNVPNSEVEAMDLLRAIVSPTTSVPLNNPINYAVPQTVKPAVEVGIDQSFFTGAPVDTSKANKNASGSSKLLSEKFPLLSAAQIDYLKKGYLGGAGEHATAIVDQGLAATGAIAPEDVSKKGIVEDVQKRFMQASGNREASRLYEVEEEMKNEATKANRELKATAERIYKSDKSAEERAKLAFAFANSLDEKDREYFVNQMGELKKEKDFAKSQGEEAPTPSTNALKDASADVLFKYNKDKIEEMKTLYEEGNKAAAKEIIIEIAKQASSDEERDRLAEMLAEYLGL